MRLKITAILFILLFVAVCARLFYWQVIKGSELSKQAASQYKVTKEVAAPRGNILSNDGTWLAVTRPGWELYADLPLLKTDPEKVANLLAPLLVDDPTDKQTVFSEYQRIYELITKKGIVWVSLKHKISSEIKKEIEKLDIEGLGFEPEDTRFYPEASSSAHVLGFVGKNEDGEDVGYFGLEGFYDLSLSGKTGYFVHEKDLKGDTLLGQGISDVSAVSGVDLVTNIDKRVQLLVEEKLKQGIERYGAKEGSVIVMDPSTGGILAMASLPSFDPIKYFEYGNAFFKNPSISDNFEPGSVFKVIVMASALDSKDVEPETKCDICAGPLKIDKYYIETWNKEYYPDSSMTDVIVHSDNVGMSFVAQKMGADKLYEYLDKFGFGRNTGIDLQGEASASLRKKGTWNEVDLVTASFGQGIAVTPIQLTRAVAAIANKGVLVKPQVVGSIKMDGWEDKIEPVTESRVISSKAAEEITQMMVEAAKNGESKWTSLRGFSVAGKTGTAQIPISGHYDDEKTIASFIGFAPSYKPKYVMLVTLKEPQTSQWASETAAPLWYSISKELFAYFGIQPNN